MGENVRHRASERDDANRERKMKMMVLERKPGQDRGSRGGTMTRWAEVILAREKPVLSSEGKEERRGRECGLVRPCETALLSAGYAPGWLGHSSRTGGISEPSQHSLGPFPLSGLPCLLCGAQACAENEMGGGEGPKAQGSPRAGCTPWAAPWEVSGTGPQLCRDFQAWPCKQAPRSRVLLTLKSRDRGTLN